MSNRDLVRQPIDVEPYFAFTDHRHTFQLLLGVHTGTWKIQLVSCARKKSVFLLLQTSVQKLSARWNSGTKLYKESYLLVWRDIPVTKETGNRICLATVEFFERQSTIHDHPLQFLGAHAQRFNKYNTWHSMCA